MRSAWLLLLVVGCGDDAFTGLLKPPPANEGMQLSLAVHVEPGQEVVVCRNFAIPEGTFDIGRFEHAMTDVSHHLLVYQLDIPAAQVTPDVIPACDESRENQQHRVGFLYGAQGPASDLTLPAGIAFPARGGLSVQLEYHVFNTSDEAVEAEAAFNLWRAHGDIVGEAGMLFLYHNRIAIPPMSRATSRIRRSYPTDFELMMLVPHMHSRGVAMQAFKDSGTGSPQPLFDVTGWENDTVYFDPPVSFQAGDVLDYHCDYNNQSSNYYFDGFSALHDEMCVTGGIYYRHGDRMPLTDEVTWGKGIVYTGANSCQQIQTCEQAIDYADRTSVPSPYDKFDLCVLSGCDAGANAYNQYDSCRFMTCKDSCVTIGADGNVDALRYDDPACTSCVDTNCPALRDACAAATCP